MATVPPPALPVGLASVEAHVRAAVAVWGREVTLGGQPVRAVFIDGQGGATLDGVPIQGRELALWMASADVPAAPERRVVVLDGSSYTVIVAEPDGMGATTLRLQAGV